MKLIFCLAAFDDGSVNTAKQFLLSCRALIGKENIFWASFKSDELLDMRNASGDFINAFKDMMSALSAKNIRVAVLSANMRNSSQIASVSPRPANTGGNSGDVNKVIPKGIPVSTVMGERPIHIPLHRTNCGKIPGVIKYAINLIDEQGKKPFVLLVDDYLYKDTKFMDHVRRWIQEKLSQDINVRICVVPENVMIQSTTDVDTFFTTLRIIDDILVCKGSLFVGMESANVIYLANSIDRPRSSILRAIENVIIINVFDFTYINFDGTSMVKKYLECLKTKTVLFTCEDCRDKVLEQESLLVGNGQNDEKWQINLKIVKSIGFVVCAPCALACHEDRGHTVKPISSSFCINKKECLCHFNRDFKVRTIDKCDLC